jgi:hypothetical protein
MTNLLSDVGIEDDEVDRADNERIEAAVKHLERGATVVAFGHLRLLILGLRTQRLGPPPVSARPPCAGGYAS